MRKIASLLTVLLFSTVSVFAQSIVKGKVIDSKDGSPLSSISVKVKGTDVGTSTDPDGSFSIDIGKKSATLEFSGVGYATKSVKATVGETVSVSLEKDVKNLNEVVVTALGVKREKRALGYATQSIGSEQLNTSGSGNPLSELSGQVAGLTVTNSSGDPGGGTFILLRGKSSITLDNQPLMVVDGILIDNSINNYDPVNTGFQAGGANADGLAGGSPTNRGIDINPSDIESITVLKGPAATALYGIKASNGALIITTKKGGGGRHGASVSINSSVTFNKVTQLPGLQDQFSQGDGGIYSGPVSGPEAGTSLSWGAAIDTLFWNGDPTYQFDKHGDIVGKSDPSAKTPVTPYNRYAFFQTGISYDNNVALSGSTDKGGYRMSLGNVYTAGTIPTTKYNKTTFSINGQSNVTNKLSISGGMNYVNSSNNKVQQGSSLSSTMLGLVRTPATFDNSNGGLNPRDPATYIFPDGSQRDYRGGGGYDNPYWVINKEPYVSNVDRAYGFGEINYQALSWLSLQYRLGGDEYNQSDKNAYDINSNEFTGGAVYLINYLNRQFNSDITATIKKTFSKDFTGSLLLGQNFFTSTNNELFIHGTPLALPNFLDISNASSVLSQEFETRYRSAAFYADADLAYKNELFLTITGRREETSTFAPANDVFFYPSASLGWVFTELKGLKNNSVLSYGKARASISQVGKDVVPYSLSTPFTSASFADGFTSGITFPVNGNSGYQITNNITTLGNPTLKPLNIYSYEGGVDLGFFHNRITVNATAYYEKTTNDLLQVSVPYSSGFAAKELNAATITNHGVELSLNTTPVNSATGFKWDLGLNWSYNINRIVSLAPGISRFFEGGFGGGEAELDAVVGKPLGIIYGDVTPHTDLNNLKSPYLIDDIKTDENYGQPLAFGAGPSQPIGNTNPDWIGSVTNNLTYKGFTFGFQIDVRYGGDIWNGTRGALANKGTAEETANRGTATVFKGMLGHLDATGNVVHYAADGITELPGPGAANTIATTYSQFYWQNVANSFGAGQETDVENGGFTKIRQVSLTYQLPKSAIGKAINSLSLTIFANNIYTWTKYDGVDPESSLTGPGNLQGLDYFNNPGVKSYGIRLNVGL
jgi:TonB-linked SusC/RagA family outer membrane protein